MKDEAGRVEEVVLVHSDVTEQRKAAEEVRRSQLQLKSVIDNAPSAIFIIGRRRRENPPMFVGTRRNGKLNVVAADAA